MASTYLLRNSSGGSDGNQKTWTFSAWVKRSTLGTQQAIFSNGENNSGEGKMFFDTDDTLAIQNDGQNGSNNKTTRVFRDTSAWYHIVWAVDANQASNDNRWKLYVNGELVSASEYGSPTINNANGYIQRYSIMDVGVGVRARFQQAGNAIMYFDGYMAHVHFTDGTQYAASDFGETDTNGQWKPKPTPSVTYGTNGFFLKFANSGSLGTDSSGNGNNFTVSGSGDQVTDTPDNVFATMNPLAVTTAGTATFSKGNCQVATVVSGSMGGYCNINFPSSGKWYCESKITTSGPSNAYIGVVEYSANDSNSFTNGDSTFYYGNGQKYVNGSTSSYGSAWSQNDIIGMAVNADDNQITFYLNGVSQGVLSETIAGKTWNAGDTSGSVSHTFQWNFGNPIYTITSGNTDDNGYGNFEYAPPTGYLALCTKNLAETLTLPIGDGKDYFNTVLWTSNGSNATVTGVGFQPDFVWQKTRNGARHHHLYNSSRFTSGYGTWLQSSNTDQEANLASTGLTSYSSDGFTHSFNSPQGFEINGETQVAWNWLNNGGTTSSNTDGTLTTTVQVNTTAGFSIVEWTGNGGGSTTVGHGLGVAPDMMIMHPLNVGTNWRVWHQDLSGGNYFLILDSTNVENNNEPIFTGAPSSTVVNLGSDYNGNGTTYIMFAFTTKEGYSKFGGYTGNGNADGTFVYTGFRPAFVMVKGRSTAQVWSMRDSVRDSFNSAQKAIYANTTNTESDNVNNSIDLLSNGFKIRNSFGTENSSGQTYIYMAFAEHPFVDSTGRPVTAR